MAWDKLSISDGSATRLEIVQEPWDGTKERADDAAYVQVQPDPADLDALGIVYPLQQDLVGLLAKEWWFWYDANDDWAYMLQYDTGIVPPEDYKNIFDLVLGAGHTWFTYTPDYVDATLLYNELQSVINEIHTRKRTANQQNPAGGDTGLASNAVWATCKATAFGGISYNVAAAPTTALFGVWADAWYDSGGGVYMLDGGGAVWYCDKVDYDFNTVYLGGGTVEKAWLYVYNPGPANNGRWAAGAGDTEYHDFIVNFYIGATLIGTCNTAVVKTGPSAQPYWLFEITDADSLFTKGGTTTIRMEFGSDVDYVPDATEYPPPVADWSSYSRAWSVIPTGEDVRLFIRKRYDFASTAVAQPGMAQPGMVQE